MSDLDIDAITQPIDFDRDPKDEFSEESLKMSTYDVEWDVEYKEAHIWSFDTSLAIFLDKGLTGLMNFKYTSPPPETERARNLFRSYAKRDEQFEDKDSDEYQELMWALDWLKENFTRLWT